MPDVHLIARYEQYLNNTGGNPAAELLTDLETNDNMIGTNLVRYLLAFAVQSQVELLRVLEDAGLLHPEVLYDFVEKCKHCHLFIEGNASFEDSTPELPIARYVHLSRGDDADEALENHEAEPSGMIATLKTWRAYGPREMRARFHDHLHEVPEGTPRIIARMQPQAWVRDQAIDAGDEVEFDITAQVLETGREAALAIEDSSDRSDQLWITAVERAEVEPHHGPFVVSCEEAITEFYNLQSHTGATEVPNA